ncbi:MAG: hypothetical protein LW878_11940, partial [Proteobacteria bacterium]|nr:hypothetical protein [Pseudomonadota bacterium]
HAGFSVEGWARGTLVGVFVSLIASHLKEILQFSTAIMTIITVQMFQIIWYLVTLTIISLKLGHFNNFGMMFWNVLPGTFLLSLVSPLLFNLLNRVWPVEMQVSRATGMEL